MPIEIIPAESAWNAPGTEQALRRWPSGATRGRLAPVARPRVSTGLRIGPQEQLFCIGSCFATELSRALHRMGYAVLSAFRALPRSPNRTLDEESMFIKYNVFSILNELRWALDPATPYRHALALVETSGGRLQDYQLKGRGYTDEPEAAQAFREAFNQAFTQVRQADVVIITLGLSEVWFDRQTGLYLNTSVPMEVVRQHPGRFEVHVLDHAQTLGALEAIYALLKAHLKPTFRLLITVSPVPLAMTFRDQDILTANAYSKAVLRTAVESFVPGKPEVGYFPSYEFALLSHPQAVWQDDLRHVDSHFVDYIMANVMHELLLDAPGAPLVPGEAALATSAAPAAGATSTALAAPTPSRPDWRLAQAQVLLHAGHPEAARQALAPVLAGPSVPAEARLLDATLRLGLAKHASAWLRLTQALRTYRHLSPWARLRQLLADRRERQARQRQNRCTGYIDRWQAPELVGWAISTTHTEPIEVEVWVNGQPLTRLRADLPRADVAAAHPGHLHCGFALTLQASGTGPRRIEVRFADTGQPLGGSPILEA